MSSKIIHGSWKNKIVASDLLAERAKKDFSGSIEEILNRDMSRKFREI
jgi:hypothetical protein